MSEGKDNISYQEKVRGALIGGAIGDALGYQIEFETVKGPRQITKFKDNKGIISDDTQMTLFTANALLWRETRLSVRGIAMLPSEAVYLAYLDWLGTQQRLDDGHQVISWIKDTPELNIMREPGMTCIEALSSGTAGTLNEPINDSKGCGGIMRIAPLGLFLNESVAGEFSAMTCALTHGNPTAIISAYILGQMIFYLVSGNVKIETALKYATDSMEKWIEGGVVYKELENAKFLNAIYKSNKDIVKNAINRALEFTKNNVDDDINISRLGSGFIAEEALSIAIYSAVKYQDSFEGAVICAVNHNGDSDSTGAITGNIVGAKLGYQKIPKYYKENVELKDLILELADDMARGVPIDKNGTVSDKKWLDKYLYIKK